MSADLILKQMMIDVLRDGYVPCHSIAAKRSCHHHNLNTQALGPHLASGRIQIHPHTEVLTADWNFEVSCWELYLSSKTVLQMKGGSAADAGRDVQDISEAYILHADHVWLATGSTIDVTAEPLFSGLMQASRAAVVVYCRLLTPELGGCLSWKHPRQLR